MSNGDNTVEKSTSSKVWVALISAIAAGGIGLGGAQFYFNTADNGPPPERTKMGLAIRSDLSELSIRITKLRESFDTIATRCAEGVVRDTTMARDIDKLEHSYKELETMLMIHLGVLSADSHITPNHGHKR